MGFAMAEVEMELILLRVVGHEVEVRADAIVEQILEEPHTAVDLGVIEPQGRHHRGRKAGHRGTPETETWSHHFGGCSGRKLSWGHHQLMLRKHLFHGLFELAGHCFDVIGDCVVSPPPGDAR